MADNNKQKGNVIDSQMEVKVEPTYIEEDRENNFSTFENASTARSNVDVGSLNMWTSRATTCLIGQYKKYRSLVGQSTQIRSLREMFEMISLQMQKHGFYFTPQKCENKWRVLERKYKNLVSRERLRKPGRMRHYGQWEHKPALEEIFNEKKRHVYLEENDLQSSTESPKYPLVFPPANDQGSDLPGGRQHQDPLAPPLTNATVERANETTDFKRTLTELFDKLIDEVNKNFSMAEKNNERRHKERMAIRQKELEAKRQILKLKQQKMQLQKCQLLAASQNLQVNNM